MLRCVKSRKESEPFPAGLRLPSLGALCAASTGTRWAEGLPGAPPPRLPLLHKLHLHALTPQKPHLMELNTYTFLRKCAHEPHAHKDTDTETHHQSVRVHTVLLCQMRNIKFNCGGNGQHMVINHKMTIKPDLCQTCRVQTGPWK